MVALYGCDTLGYLKNNNKKIKLGCKGMWLAEKTSPVASNKILGSL